MEATQRRCSVKYFSAVLWGNDRNDPLSSGFLGLFFPRQYIFVRPVEVNSRFSSLLSRMVFFLSSNIFLSEYSETLNRTFFFCYTS